MEELIHKVEELLDAHFPGQNSFEIEETVPGEKIGGSFIASYFNKMRQVDRQTIMRQMLREQLSREDYLKLGVIFTMTPQEVAVMREHMEEHAVAA